MTRNMTWTLLTLLAMLGLCSCRSHAPTPAPPAASALRFADLPLIIPSPKHLRLTQERLRLGTDTRLVIPDDATPLDRMAALSVQQELHEHFGLPRLPIVAMSRAHGPGYRIVFGEPTRMPLAKRLLRDAGAAASGRPEGYRLHVGTRGAVVAGHDPAGTFYGAQTLCQMLQRDRSGVYAIGAQVEDYPSLSWRGAHLFVGNHALPFHEKLIARVFARLKMNALVLQCEQAKWDTLGPAAPPWAMSKTDLKTEVAYAQRYGLTVTPLINSVGHMPWLFTDRVNLPLAEDPQTPYAANVSDPQTYRLLFRLYDEALTTTGAKTLHIGGDEVTLRGRYPYRSRSRYPTVADAYSAHITRLHDYLKARGVRTMLWSDMMLAPGEAKDGANAPSLIQAQQMRSRLPHDIVLTDWHYKASDPFTSPQRFRAAGFGPVIGATWAVPANIAGFSRALAANKQRGLLQTTWAGYNSSEADLVHEKYQFVAFVLAAEYAWNGGQRDPAHLPYDPAQVFDRLYGPLPKPAPQHSALALPRFAERPDV